MTTKTEIKHYLFFDDRLRHEISSQWQLALDLAAGEIALDNTPITAERQVALISVWRAPAPRGPWDAASIVGEYWGEDDSEWEEEDKET
jgi:hypothetical protein